MSKSQNTEDVRFEKFGTVSFTKTTRVNDFIDYLENGQVMASRCKLCGQKFFPPRADCCQCISSDMDWCEVSGIGKLVSFSRLNYAPIGFESDLPYCIALIDYGDFRVFGRIDNKLDIAAIKIGMSMVTVVNKLQNGQLNYIFKNP
jgi:uncharacterized OB-fold protein